MPAFVCLWQKVIPRVRAHYDQGPSLRDYRHIFQAVTNQRKHEIDKYNFYDIWMNNIHILHIKIQINLTFVQSP